MVDGQVRGDVEARLAAGERLTATDAEVLLGGDDLAWLGSLAARVRAAATGDRVLLAPADLASRAAPTVRYGRDATALATELVAVRETGPHPLVVLARDEVDPEISPAESMRVFAVARLVLDNAAELACDLASHPAVTAELLPLYGASALVGDDPAADDLAELIGDAGFHPVHVDAAGATLRDYGPAVPQADRRATPQSVFS